MGWAERTRAPAAVDRAASSSGLTREASLVAKYQELAYAEATRAITQQQTKLDNLRTRAGLIFSAASVAAGFLGDAAIGDTGIHGCALWVAVAAYVGVGLAAIVILLPVYEFHFSFSAQKILSEYADRDDDETYAWLATYLEDQFDANEKKINRLFILFDIAAGLLGLEILAWLIAL